MSWHPTFPVGNISVKANRTIGQDNTTYIETTMGNSIVGTNTDTTRDHFWDVGSDEDGRHRFIQSVGFTSTAAAPDDVYPVLGSGMQTILFPLTTNGEVQWFHKNLDDNTNIYQFIPNFITGTIVLTSSFANIEAIPANVYGEIFLFTTLGGNTRGQAGFFKTSASQCDGWSYAQRIQGDTDPVINVRLGNGTDASGLNLRARTDEATSGQTWNYKITYRAY